MTKNIEINFPYFPKLLSIMAKTHMISFAPVLLTAVSSGSSFKSVVTTVAWLRSAVVTGIPLKSVVITGKSLKPVGISRTVVDACMLFYAKNKQSLSCFMMRNRIDEDEDDKQLFYYTKYREFVLLFNYPGSCLRDYHYYPHSDVRF